MESILLLPPNLEFGIAVKSRTKIFIKSYVLIKRDLVVYQKFSSRRHMFMMLISIILNLVITWLKKSCHDALIDISFGLRGVSTWRKHYWLSRTRLGSKVLPNISCDRRSYLIFLEIKRLRVDGLT